MRSTADLRRAGAGIGTDPGQHTPVIDQRGSHDDAGGGERIEQEPAVPAGSVLVQPHNRRRLRPAVGAPHRPARARYRRLIGASPPDRIFATRSPGRAGGLFHIARARLDVVQAADCHTAAALAFGLGQATSHPLAGGGQRHTVVI
jgi:hypothetical protein